MVSERLTREAFNHVLEEYDYPFMDKITGVKQIIRASSAELAMLRAWKINQNLTFDIKEAKDGKQSDNTM